mmetsp:Transcript_26067/g.38852  ORF Transcript_26067/g.38852 Transcript_26067/m.38852 type:complete len:318 (-) Transcript_26067:111-1064(-)
MGEIEEVNDDTEVTKNNTDDGHKEIHERDDNDGTGSSFTDHPNIGDDSESKQLTESYNKRLSAISEVQKSLQNHTAEIGERVSSLQEHIRKKEKEYSCASDNFRKFRREFMMSSKSDNETVVDAEFMDRLEAREDEKEGKIERLRLKQIGLQKTVKELEQCLKEKEKVADGLDFADLEHVQNEHAALSSKLALRIAEISKVSNSKKATSRSVANLKEQIAELTRVNRISEEKQAKLDEELTKKARQLYSLRQKHAQLCTQTEPIKKEAKFTKNKMLLQDYAQTEVKLKDMKQELAHLKERHQAMQQELNPKHIPNHE